LAAHPEIETVAVDLLNSRQRQSEAPHVFGVSHQPLRICAVEPGTTPIAAKTPPFNDPSVER
jgi:hypothetical protein